MRIYKIFCTLLISLSCLQAVHAARAKIADGDKAELMTLLKSYEGLFDAFFNYDSKKVEEQAKKLQQDISTVKSAELKKNLESPKAKLLEIKSTSDREVNNQNMHLVSMALIYLVNKFDIGNDYNVYACPMVQKKWIQNSKRLTRVTNPYDPSMPNCGSQVTEY